MLLNVAAASASATPESGADSAWRVVNYWSEWCAPCRKEIPMLNALSIELAPHGVQVVGINFDDDPRDKTLQIAGALGIEFPSLTPLEAELLNLRGPNVMPTTYILRPDNTVAASLVGLQSREQILEALSGLGVRVSYEIESPAPPDSHLSRVTTDESGQVYLSWVSEDGPMARLSYAQLDDGKWSDVRPLGEGADWFVNWADFPALSVHGGNMVAHWLRRSGEDTYDYDIVARFFDASTRRWSAEQTINTDGVSAEHGFVSLLPAGGANTLISWLDGRNTKMQSDAAAMTLRSALYDAAGRKLSEWELDERVCDCCQTSSAMTDQGPVVVYRDRSEAEVRDTAIVRFVDDAWTEPRAVYVDGWQVQGCPVNGPAVAAAGRRVAVAWFTAKDEKPRVQLALSSNSGESFAPPVLVAEVDTNGRVDTVILDSGDIVVSWIDNSGGAAGIMLSRFSPDGDPVDTRRLAITSASRRSGFPVMTSVGETVYVSWTDVSQGSRVRVARVNF
jgi:thiol-disulfide isomerase/thioredoxin